MPHFAFEMISKAYTRRKNFLQRIFPFNCKSKSYVGFHAENFAQGERRRTRRLETIYIVNQFHPCFLGESSRRTRATKSTSTVGCMDKSEPGGSKRSSRSNRKPRKVRRCSRRTTS